jgi:hypothetical protein
LLNASLALRQWQDITLLPVCLLKDGVIGRPSLWIAEDFGCCASG